jgi:hypothetical protein
MSFFRHIIFLLGSILNLFGYIWSAFSRTVRPILEIFGFADPIPEQIAASEAEAALASPRTHSTLDRRAVCWAPEQKLKAIIDWCEWKTGRSFGPEPSLAGLSVREKIKLKAADEQTLTVLAQRPLAQIDAWMQSSRKALQPLKHSKFGQLQEAQGTLDRQTTPLRDRKNSLGADVRSASLVDEADNVLRQVEEALSLQTSGLAFS